MDIVARLKAYMDHVGLQISQFADQAQIPRPTLSQILSGRNKKISNELLAKLHTAFPTLNISWLLFGDGDMDTDSAPEPKKPDIQSVSTDTALHPAQSQTATPPSPSTQQPSAQKMAQPCIDFAPYNADDTLADKPSGNVGKRETSQPKISVSTNSKKKIQNIMVFYSDNSFEIFTPSVQ